MDIKKFRISGRIVEKRSFFDAAKECDLILLMVLYQNGSTLGKVFSVDGEVLFMGSGVKALHLFNEHHARQEAFYLI